MARKNQTPYRWRRKLLETMRRAALESTMNEAKNSTATSTEMVAIPLVKLENLIAAVEQLKAGKLRPFMYAIQGPDGEAHIDENCVAGDPAALAVEVNGLNDSPDTGYQIVPVYLGAQPAEQPTPVQGQGQGQGQGQNQAAEFAAFQTYFNSISSDGTKSARKTERCRSAALAAWREATRRALAQRAASVLAQEGQPQEPPIINTQEARLYLVDFMMQHFTDKTFKKYIIGEATRNALAGDFAWQMARALRMLAAPVPAASVQPEPEAERIAKVLMHMAGNDLIRWNGTGNDDDDAWNTDEEYRATLAAVREGLAAKQPDIGRDAALVADPEYALYLLRTSVYHEAKRLVDDVLDRDDIESIGDRLIAFSQVCENCHGCGEDGDDADANGEGGWIGRCGKCVGKGVIAAHPTTQAAPEVASVPDAAQFQAGVREGYERAAKALGERAAGWRQHGEHNLEEEVMQCRSMLHDQKPAAHPPANVAQIEE